MLKIIAIFQIGILWFALACYLEQRENSRRLIRLLRNQERLADVDAEFMASPPFTTRPSR